MSPLAFRGAGAGASRIALYSHDAMGLGHLRRNLLIARRLVRDQPDRHLLVITGSQRATAFDRPPGVDVLSLPEYHKLANGAYVSGSLGLCLADLRALRSRILETTLTSYAPHLLIVDKLPGGLLGELEPALERLPALATRRVLGLRDVLDAPAAVRSEWEANDWDQAIARHYDEIWVYGDPRVCDTVREYGLGAAVADRLRYAGYLDSSRRVLNEADAGPRTSAPDLLCQAGGGQDGAALAADFMGARFPRGQRAVVLAGPCMPDPDLRSLQTRASFRPDLDLIRFSPRQGSYLRSATRVVSMGGYNSLLEAVAMGKPTLVVPRIRPRSEQWIRALRFAELGLVELLHPDNSSSGAISDWLVRPTAERPPVRQVLDLDGLERVARWSTRLLRSVRRVPRVRPEDARPVGLHA